MLKKNIATLLESEMDRKDFLKTLGIAVAAFTGATAAIKTVTSHTAMLSGNQAKQGAVGYGSSFYGGKKVVERQVNTYS